MPGNFRSDVVIRGVQAGDLFNLNALLGNHRRFQTSGFSTPPTRPT